MGMMGDNAPEEASDILGLVTTTLQGVPDPMAKQEIHRAASDFLRWSQAWRETLDLGDLEDEVYS